MNRPRLLPFVIAGIFLGLILCFFSSNPVTVNAAQNNGNGRNIERVTPHTIFDSSKSPEVFAVQYGGKTYLVVQAGSSDGGVAIIEHTAKN